VKRKGRGRNIALALSSPANQTNSNQDCPLHRAASSPSAFVRLQISRKWFTVVQDYFEITLQEGLFQDRISLSSKLQGSPWQLPLFSQRSYQEHALPNAK
jgi:hypothetical protein